MELIRRVARAALAATSLVALMSVVPAHAAERYLDPIFDQVDVLQSNVVYGAAVNTVTGRLENLLLEVYAPAGDTATSRAAIVFAHGGSFTGGSRNDSRIISLVQGWARRGFVVMNIDYRLTPGENIPHLAAQGVLGMSQAMRDAQHDMQAAVRWTRAHATELGINTDEIIASGESAGAITAWETGINADDPGDSGTPGERSDVAAVLSLWGAAEPPHIDPGAAPVLDMHNVGDTTVPEPFATQACALMLAWGNVCERVYWPAVSHTAFPRSEDIWETTSNFACRYAIAGCTATAPVPVEVHN
jgi:predicted esterase